MTLYQRYARLPIRFSELGLERGSQKSSYFCTPKRARVIGWAGVDGVHFCFVPGYGDMVFAVSPMAAGDCVQAVSRSFEDFLRLVLACGGSAAIEQARYWTRAQFEEFVASERSDDPPRLDALRGIEGLGITPMPDPYGYLETLRREFDAAPLQPGEVLLTAEEPGPFPVVWEGSLHGRPRLRRPAREVAVDAAFSWGNETWRVPYLYLCGEGIVVDFCIGVEPARVRDFLRYYEELCGLGTEPTEEQQDELERLNPLHIAFHSVLAVDGEELSAKHGSSTFWVPESCGSEGLTMENCRTRAIVERYGLDEEKAWVFWRSDYPWSGKSGVKKASLHLSRDKVSITAAHFTDPQSGEEIPFTHPVTGERHVLQVLEVEPKRLPDRTSCDPEVEYPAHFTALTVTAEPPVEGLTLRDCAESDPPRGGRGCMGVAIFGRGKAQDETQQTVCAASSMHFVPPTHTTWRVVVQEKPVEDVEMELL